MAYHGTRFSYSLSNINTKGKIKSINLSFNKNVDTKISIIGLNQKETYKELYESEKEYDNKVTMNISSNEFSFNFKFYENYSYFIILFYDDITDNISNINIKYNLFYKDIKFENTLSTSIMYFDQSNYTVSSNVESINYASLSNDVIFGFDNLTDKDIYIDDLSIEYKNEESLDDYDLNFDYKIYKGIIFTISYNLTQKNNSNSVFMGLNGELSITAKLNNNSTLVYNTKLTVGI